MATNPRDGFAVVGAPNEPPSKSILLTADDTIVDPAGVSAILLSSDNTTASNRTFTIPVDSRVGRELLLVFTTGSSNTCQLLDSGTMRLVGNWEPVQYEVLKLVSDGTNWLEQYRGPDPTSAGIIVNADIGASAAIAFSKLAALTSGNIIVGSASTVPTSITMSGDATIIADGTLTIANSAITNAKVSASAAIDYSKLATLTSGNVLVGSAGNVATSVAMAGDITIVAAGTTTIGAAKVTEAMQKTQQLAGLHSARIAHGIYTTTEGFAAGAHTIGATIPINAFITGAWYWVKTTFTSATDAATLAISLEGANDIVSAIAISDGSNPWDTSALPVEGIPKIETTSTFLKTTAARALTVTTATETLTAGVLHVWVQYVVFE